MNERPCDDTIHTVDLERIHRLITKVGIHSPQNRLAERESALAAYVIFSADQIAETTRISGAPSTLVRWVRDEVTARMLVVIEAQQVAQYQLWRDFMGDDEGESTPPKINEGSNGDTDGERTK